LSNRVGTKTKSEPSLIWSRDVTLKESTPQEVICGVVDMRIGFAIN
jgi:hypothetical protein